MADGPVARVLVDSPLPQLDQLFDYRVPGPLTERVIPGVRVRVPLRRGGRVTTGWVIEVVDESAYLGALSEVDDVVSEVPLLTSEVWRLVRAVADRAAGSASDILRLAVPSRYVRVERAWQGAASDPGPLPQAVAVPGFDAGDDLPRRVAAGERMSLAPDPHPVTLPDGTTVGGWAAALAALAVTTLAADRSALVVVPDARDQDQLEAALAAVVDPRRVLRTDARQSGGDRYRAFLDATGDDARIVIGNRSTVYSPAPRLGLIALWDDGDPLHVEPLAPGVHPRDAALVRQEQSGAALVFAAHSRSVEVQRLVEIGWVHPVASRARPRVVLADDDAAEARARIPSAVWRQASEALGHGPVLVQVARPGHTPALVCAQCRIPATCRACGGRLAVPAAGGVATCTLCGTAAAGWRCPVCEGTALRAVSVGATRTAEELGRAFPGVRVILSDGERHVLRVGAEPALVVATRGAEPVADGGYRAVLLLDGERMLLRESLRVAEDCLRWWSNAAALAARGAPVFLVGVGGALGTALATWRHADWAHGELAARRELRFPPAVRVASVVASSDRVAHATDAARAAAPDADVLGPVPVDDGLVRAIVRFGYPSGATVAGALRAEMVRVATERRRPVAGRRPTRPPVLRVRFDDPDVP